MARFVSVVVVLIAAFFAGACAAAEEEQVLHGLGLPHGRTGQQPKFSTTALRSGAVASTAPGSGAASTARSGAARTGAARSGGVRAAPSGNLDYVAVKKFSSKDCSGSSTLIGIVQNQCVPNFDQSTTPPTLKSYQIYSANPQIATVIDFALSDTTCKGKPIATTPLTEGKCYPITATLSYSFSSGSTPATLPSVHGLFYASYKSMSDCQSQQSVIAVSQLTDTYSVPAQFWGEAIKLTCASPSVVEILALPPSTKPPAQLNLGACSAEAPGGYAIRLQCFM